MWRFGFGLFYPAFLLPYFLRAWRLCVFFGTPADDAEQLYSLLHPSSEDEERTRRDRSRRGNHQSRAKDSGAISPRAAAAFASTSSLGMGGAGGVTALDDEEGGISGWEGQRISGNGAPSDTIMSDFSETGEL